MFATADDPQLFSEESRDSKLEEGESKGEDGEKQGPENFLTRFLDAKG
jgi:hypothetical protein